ncbi:MAG: glutamate synthase subunit alpha, partial [Proteobacteria bacterium]|nr:glutamate synthase subunit alpha [Pseudomonadota bacterium]
LRKKFAGKPEHAVNYFFLIAEELRELMAKLGFRNLDDMIGRVDRLDWDRATTHWKAKGLDFTQLLFKADVPHAIRHCESQQQGLDHVIDVKLLELAKPALENGEKIELHLPIRNTDRTVGTILGSELSLRHGEEGLPEDSITIHFTGSAGQSFGAFVPRGMTLWVHGETNDYCGKGLSGGKIVVRAPDGARYDPAENIITGNVALYGATAGEAYFQGIAGERFCVRNSGAQAVVEGVGDHGCEYMTGGRVVVLGPTGRNFAAGMSGGFAYVLDPDGSFPTRVNAERVDLERLSAEDEEILQRLVRRHYEYTRSERADEVLRKWNSYAPKFVKVFPKDLKLALDARINAGTGNG